MRLVDQGDRRHDLARRAVPALQAVMLHERKLQRVQLAVVGNALDRRDVFAATASCQRQTAEDPPAVNMGSPG
jgi:hypothetical protein